MKTAAWVNGVFSTLIVVEVLPYLVRSIWQHNQSDIGDAVVAFLVTGIVWLLSGFITRADE